MVYRSKVKNRRGSVSEVPKQQQEDTIAPTEAKEEDHSQMQRASKSMPIVESSRHNPSKAEISKLKDELDVLKRESMQNARYHTGVENKLAAAEAEISRLKQQRVPNEEIMDKQQLTAEQMEIKNLRAEMQKEREARQEAERELRRLESLEMENERLKRQLDVCKQNANPVQQKDVQHKISDQERQQVQMDRIKNEQEQEQEQARRARDEAESEAKERAAAQAEIRAAVAAKKAAEQAAQKAAEAERKQKEQEEELQRLLEAQAQRDAKKVREEERQQQQAETQAAAKVATKVTNKHSVTLSTLLDVPQVTHRHMTGALNTVLFRIPPGNLTLKNWQQQRNTSCKGSTMLL